MYGKSRVRWNGEKNDKCIYISHRVRFWAPLIINRFFTHMNICLVVHSKVLWETGPFFIWWDSPIYYRTSHRPNPCPLNTGSIPAPVTEIRMPPQISDTPLVGATTALENHGSRPFPAAFWAVWTNLCSWRDSPKDHGIFWTTGSNA